MFRPTRKSQHTKATFNFFPIIFARYCLVYFPQSLYCLYSSCDYEIVDDSSFEHPCLLPETNSLIAYVKNSAYGGSSPSAHVSASFPHFLRQVRTAPLLDRYQISCDFACIGNALLTLLEETPRTPILRNSPSGGINLLEQKRDCLICADNIIQHSQTFQKSFVYHLQMLEEVMWVYKE